MLNHHPECNYGAEYDPGGVDFVPCDQIMGKICTHAYKMKT